jgi:hypothetical protein
MSGPRRRRVVVATSELENLRTTLVQRGALQREALALRQRTVIL